MFKLDILEAAVQKGRHELIRNTSKWADLTDTSAQ